MQLALTPEHRITYSSIGESRPSALIQFDQIWLAIRRYVCKGKQSTIRHISFCTGTPQVKVSRSIITPHMMLQLQLLLGSIMYLKIRSVKKREFIDFVVKIIQFAMNPLMPQIHHNFLIKCIFVALLSRWRDRVTVVTLGRLQAAF